MNLFAAEAKPKKKKAERYFDGAAAAAEAEAPPAADKPKVWSYATCTQCTDVVASCSMSVCSSHGSMPSFMASDSSTVLNTFAHLSCND